jgi:hypothetical protein
MAYTVQHVINVVYQTVDRRPLLLLLLLLARDWKYLPEEPKQNFREGQSDVLSTRRS